MTEQQNAATPIIETRDLKKYFSVGKNAQLHAVDGINLTLYRLDQVMAGAMDDVLQPLADHYQTEALKAN